MGGTQPADGKVNFMELKWAEEKMGDAKTEAELKAVMDDIAQLSGGVSNYEAGFT
jgi:hypothetical protein